MKTELLRNEEIDRVKWDKCILTAIPSLVYANSWYLDVVSPNWQALVIDDYQAVFPLPIKKKLGLSYCHQPLFTQQLGLFSADPGKFEETVVLKSIPRTILSLRLFLNHKHKTTEGGDFKKRLNHIISLNQLPAVKKGYNQNTKRNLKQAMANGLELRVGLDIDTFVEFKRETSSAVLNDDSWRMMKSLIRVLIDHDSGEFFGAYKEGILVSALFLSKYNGRITYLFSASSTEGKKLRASFFLVNELLETYAGSGKTLDFEGSMDENISRFFKGFGAVEEEYYEYRKGLQF